MCFKFSTMFKTMKLNVRQRYAGGKDRTTCGCCPSSGCSSALPREERRGSKRAGQGCCCHSPSERNRCRRRPQASRPSELRWQKRHSSTGSREPIGYHTETTKTNIITALDGVDGGNDHYPTGSRGKKKGGLLFKRAIQSPNMK